MVYKYRGGKLRRWDKLSPEAQEDLLYDLLFAFSLLKNFDDSAQFITDLLTRDEVRFLSKRLRIAKLLLSEKTYREIEEDLKVSHGTIAKVAVWLQEKGEGFRRVVEKIPQRSRPHRSEDYGTWEKYKGVNVGAVWESLLGDGRKVLAKKETSELHKTLETLSAKDVVRHRVDESYNGDFKEKTFLKPPRK